MQVYKLTFNLILRGDTLLCFHPVLYSLSLNLSDILHTKYHCVGCRRVDSRSRFMIFHRCICVIYGGLKFETKASQVQLFCLHVIHSDVVDNTCYAHEMVRKKYQIMCFSVSSISVSVGGDFPSIEIHAK